MLLLKKMAEDLEAEKLVINSLLIANRKPLTISEFIREYKTLENRPVPYQKFGCANIHQFLDKISDTVTVTRRTTGEDLIQAKVKQEVEHIERMVKQQKPSSTKPKVKHTMHRPPARGKFQPRGRGGGRCGRDHAATAMTSQKTWESSGYQAMTSQKSWELSRSQALTSQKLFEPSCSQVLPPGAPDSDNASPTSVTARTTSQRRGVSRLHYSLLRNSSCFNSTETGFPVHMDTKHIGVDPPDPSTQYVKQELILVEPLSTPQSENFQEVTNAAQHAQFTGDCVGQASSSKSVSVKDHQYYMPYSSLVQKWKAENYITSSMYQSASPQALPGQGANSSPGQPILRPSLCHPFTSPQQRGNATCNGEPSDLSRSSVLNPSAAAYEPQLTWLLASSGQEKHELAAGAIGREFADNQTQVAPEVKSKGTSTGDLNASIPQGFAMCLRNLLEEYPTGLDIEVLMEMIEERIGSSAYFEQNKHPLQMLPDILSSVSSACVMPDSRGMFRVMLLNSDLKQNVAPALPGDLGDGLLSILLEAPQGVEASVLLDMYESRFGEHHYIKAYGQRTSNFIRNILYELPFTTVKNCGDGTHIVQMVEGPQGPVHIVGHSVQEISADEFITPEDECAYPLQELPHCWSYSVAIGEVFSPSEFYVLITTDGALDRLTSLMTELDEYYNSASADFYSVNIGDLKPGFVCAALYVSNGQPLWHRAVVKSIQAREVFVFYIDYGTVMPVKVADIRKLRSDFLELPAQAIKASLSGVKPKNEQAWTPEAKERFLQLVQMGECSCSAVSKEEDTFVVQLLMSDGNMEYSLSDVLIYEDFAVSTIVSEEIAHGSCIETWTFLDGSTADIIVWNGGRYMSSMSISKLLGWKEDLISKKLSEKCIRLDGVLLEKKCDPELHLEVCLSDDVFYFDNIQLYHLHSVPDILRILQHPSNNLKRELESKIASINTLRDQPVFMDDTGNSDTMSVGFNDEDSAVSPNEASDANRLQETNDSSALALQSQTEDVTGGESSQDAFRHSIETKLAGLKEKRRSLRMSFYENRDSVAASDLEFIERKIDSFTKVLKDLDMNSGSQVVMEPSRVPGLSPSNHASSVARSSSKGVVEKFQSKLMEALMTSKQK